MKAEAWIMVSLLRHGVQFLPPIPDERETELVKDLARDAHQLFTKAVWEDSDLPNLLEQWFNTGRGYESSTSDLSAVSGHKEAALKDLVSHEMEILFVQIGTSLDCLCRLLWLWFQRGRSYERGNAA